MCKCIAWHAVLRCLGQLLILGLLLLDLAKTELAELISIEKFTWFSSPFFPRVTVYSTVYVPKPQTKIHKNYYSLSISSTPRYPHLRSMDGSLRKCVGMYVSTSQWPACRKDLRLHTSERLAKRASSARKRPRIFEIRTALRHQSIVITLPTIEETILAKKSIEKANGCEEVVSLTSISQLLPKGAAFSAPKRSRSAVQASRLCDESLVLQVVSQNLPIHLLCQSTCITSTSTLSDKVPQCPTFCCAKRSLAERKDKDDTLWRHGLQVLFATMGWLVLPWEPATLNRSGISQNWVSAVDEHETTIESNHLFACCSLQKHLLCIAGAQKRKIRTMMMRKR